MKKVFKKEEEELFSNSMEAQNLENFKNLLPYFYLNDKTMGKLLASFDPSTRTDKDNSFDIMLGLNAQRRRWFSVESNAHTDNSFSLYSEYILYLYNHGNDYLTINECKIIIRNYSLNSYEVYNKGKILENGQEFKLFKFLLKKKLFSQSVVQRITSSKPPKSTIYFCISRNPVDYLFCATHQSFKSCESLSSPHSGAFYMGLGGLSLDPNRCLLFLTTGEKTKYNTKGLDFLHFPYISRSWGIWLSNDVISIIRYYPQSVISFESLLKEINIHSTKDLDGEMRSKYKFIMPRFINGEKSFIFLDHIGMSHDKSGHYYDSYNGCTGCIMEEFNWSNGFEKLDSFEDLLYAHECECVRCGGRLNEDDIWFDRNDEGYCYDCYHDRYVTCDKCGDEIMREDSYTCDDGDCTLCDHCFDNYGFYCEDCGGYFYKDTIYSVSDKSYKVCSDCIGRYNFCEKCDTYYETICKNCAPYCHKCKQHYTDVCDCQLKLEGI